MERVISWMFGESVVDSLAWFIFHLESSEKLRSLVSGWSIKWLLDLSNFSRLGDGLIDWSVKWWSNTLWWDKFFISVISWLIDRSSFFFHRPCATFRLVMEREMRSCGEEPSDCRIKYLNLWFRLTAGWLIDQIFVSLTFCYFILVMEREMQSRGLIKTLKLTFYSIS